MNRQEFLEESLEYFKGAFSLIPYDAPDGAWLQMHIDTADQMLERVKEDMEVETTEQVDGYDVTMYYLEHKK